MALRIQKRSWKNADGSVTQGWRLIVEEYRGDSRRDTYPKRDEYPRYGLDPSDPLDVAKEKLKAIRARDKVERTVTRRAKIDRRMKLEALKESAFLPKPVYAAYLSWLCDRRLWKSIPEKTECHLRATRRLVLAVDISPSDWSSRPERIYRWFIDEGLSLSTLQKIWPLLNDYGYFYCREFKQPFLAVPPPRGQIAIKIDDANHEARGGRTNESKPLSPEKLEGSALPEEQERWVRYSIYFGLRPKEVDHLTPDDRGTFWDIGKDAEGVAVLKIYQPKLISVPRARRWKRIPAILPEQCALLQEMKAGLPVKRPYPKTLQSALRGQYGTYAGRKGFERLMREHGQDFINISRWLGHRNVMRTEQNYREAEAVEYSPVKKRPRK